MSHRRRVHDVVARRCDATGAAVTLAEIRRHLARSDMPPHLDAVCGSLVRTGHLEALPARGWEREHRNAYRPAGSAFAVEEAATAPSRPELVMGAIRALWNEDGRHGLPIASREIRRFLREADPEQALVALPTALPTTLNELRRSGPKRAPLIEPVRVDGLRAQRWVPFGAEWQWHQKGLAAATRADLTALAVRRTLVRSDQALVTAAEVVRTGVAEEDTHAISNELPSLLAEVSRPVTSSPGGSRVPRRHPAVVRIGEIGGEALYTTPDQLRSSRGRLSAALYEYRWRQWREAWVEHWMEQELDFLQHRARTSPLRQVRHALMARRVRIFRYVAERLHRRAPRHGEGGPYPAEVVRRLAHAEHVLGGATKVKVLPSWLHGPRWLTADEATACAIQRFGLGDDPPQIEQGFLATEVRRRRIHGAHGRTIPAVGAPVRWVYDPVTLYIACAVRWGSAKEAVLARHADAVLGPVRSLEAVRRAMGDGAWSDADEAAVRSVLG